MRCTETVNILEIARLSELGLTQREIADSVKCGKSTVGNVQKRCRDAGLTYAAASPSMLLYNKYYKTRFLRIRAGKIRREDFQP